MSATVVPSGTSSTLCECGCGRPSRLRFLHGHNLKIVEQPQRREVPTSILREAFERSGMTRPDVARALGWRNRHGWADGDRFARAIGLKTESRGHGYGWHYRQSTSYERAVELVLAMGLDPVDFGL